ncbi:hypothetical protein THMIRHAS_18340 [Thiosulfatimonas sediminis]|uniref:Uncharacterized protein n=1 Tax=Thiosulfatimonas sediminis TaxID=2675054 RepID=A0A6F8PWF7_9GAMM|nr:hypothetical protein [Thiosulfatimonas sediminis]BBP46461.1 hypothetical protein THMIRHAS_18340 [Thiosulfatimonas sediminis]
MKLVFWIPVLVLQVPFLVYAADEAAIAHGCQKPVKPASYQNFAEFAEFNKHFIDYKKCMNLFIEEHERAMERHHQAATNAVQEWNTFLNQNLN